MSDKATLIIGGKEFGNFLGYRVSSDLFEAADAFMIDVADPDFPITAGSKCTLMIEGMTELVGIIDKVRSSYDKQGRHLTLEGRDLMGLLVDSYCTSWSDLQSISLKDLAVRLTQDLSYLRGVRIIYGKGNKNRAVDLTPKTEDYEYIQIKPGQTRFDVLKTHAMARGLLFFSLPDGTLVFGEPLTSGQASFFFQNTLDGRSNNILAASLVDDLSRRYKTVTITGQVQGEDDMEPAAVNIKTTRTDPIFPFDKPFVATVYDGQDPQKYARILMDGMRFDGWQLEIRTDGHSQDGKVYEVNSIGHVKDEVLGINSDLLCYSRTFEKDKEGVFTTLKFSKLGALPS